MGCRNASMGRFQWINRLVATPHVPPIADQSSSPASRPSFRKPSQYMYGRNSRIYDIRLTYGGDVIARSKDPSIDCGNFLASPNTTCTLPFGPCPAPSSTNRALSWNTWPMSISRGMYNCRSSLKDMDWWLKAAFDSWISVLQNATNRRLRSGESSSLSASMPAASVQRNSTASRRHHLAMLWIGGAFAGSIVPRFTASWIRLHAPRVEAIEALE